MMAEAHGHSSQVKKIVSTPTLPTTPKITVAAAAVTGSLSASIAAPGTVSKANDSRRIRISSPDEVFSLATASGGPSASIATNKELSVTDMVLRMMEGGGDIDTPKNFAIFVGNQGHATNYKELQRLNITRVLNVSDSIRFTGLESDELEVLHFPLSDFGDTDLLEGGLLDQILQVIQDAKSADRKILVHCSQGVNRSPTVVIAYLIAKEGWTLKRAWEHVKLKRPMAAPHELYFKQLIEIERRTHGSTTIDFESYCANSLQAFIRDLRASNAAKRLQDTNSSTSPSDSPTISPSSSGALSPDCPLEPVSCTTSSGVISFRLEDLNLSRDTIPVCKEKRSSFSTPSVSKPHAIAHIPSTASSQLFSPPSAISGLIPLVTPTPSEPSTVSSAPRSIASIRSIRQVSISSTLPQANHNL